MLRGRDYYVIPWNQRTHSGLDSCQRERESVCDCVCIFIVVIDGRFEWQLMIFGAVLAGKINLVPVYLL